MHSTWHQRLAANRIARVKDRRQSVRKRRSCTHWTSIQSGNQVRKLYLRTWRVVQGANQGCCQTLLICDVSGAAWTHIIFLITFWWMEWDTAGSRRKRAKRGALKIWGERGSEGSVQALLEPLHYMRALGSFVCDPSPTHVSPILLDRIAEQF